MAENIMKEKIIIKEETSHTYCAFTAKGLRTAEDTCTAEDSCTAEDTCTAEDSCTAEDTCTVEDSCTAEDTCTADDTFTVEDSCTAEDTCTVEDTCTAEDTCTVEDSCTAEDTCTVEDSCTAEDTCTVEDTFTVYVEQEDVKKESPDIKGIAEHNLSKQFSDPFNTVFRSLQYCFRSLYFYFFLYFLFIRVNISTMLLEHTIQLQMKNHCLGFSKMWSAIICPHFKLLKKILNYQQSPSIFKIKS